MLPIYANPFSGVKHLQAVGPFQKHCYISKILIYIFSSNQCPQSRKMLSMVPNGLELILAVQRRISKHSSPLPPHVFSYQQAPEITAELFVEVLGTLANLHIPEFDFLGLVRKHKLLEFVAKYAQPGAVDDDILLEVVMFVGVLCNEGTAPMLVDSGLVSAVTGCASKVCAFALAF